MIVLAFTEGELFAALVNDYQQFLIDGLPRLIKRIESPGNLETLYRRLHTYKGLLAQYSFHDSPRCLHEIETRLCSQSTWTSHRSHRIDRSGSAEGRTPARFGQTDGCSGT